MPSKTHTTQIQNAKQDPQSITSSIPVYTISSTNDHSWEVETEKQRILHLGGRVEKINKKIGPLRVWLKEEDKPGLAMTRSIGDHIAKDIGVISTPEVHFEHLDTNQQYCNTFDIFLIILDGFLIDYINIPNRSSTYVDFYALN